MTSEARRMGSSAWAGWVFFGAIMLVMAGFLQSIAGLVALFNDEYYWVTRDGLVVTVDYTTWGWVHLALGIVATISGFGVMVGQKWARVLGIGMAGLSAIANVAFLSAQPIWSVLIIALDVVVIYAFAVHGREVADAYDA